MVHPRYSGAQRHSLEFSKKTKKVGANIECDANLLKMDLV